MTDLSPRRGIQPLVKAKERRGRPGEREPSRLTATINDPNFLIVVIVSLTGLLVTLGMTVLLSSQATEVLTQF